MAVGVGAAKHMGLFIDFNFRIQGTAVVTTGVVNKILELARQKFVF